MTRRELLIAALVLVASTTALAALQFLVFRDAHHIGEMLLDGLAFLPLQVLFVTLIVDRVLSERDRRARQHHMNMVIGTFFSSTGQPLLQYTRRLVPDGDGLWGGLEVGPTWTAEQLGAAIARVGATDLQVRADPETLLCLRDFLAGQRDFLLRLLENQTLLEHEAFTDLLWAVFHLTEELLARQSLTKLPATDLRHLEIDVGRAYSLLLRQWLAYLLHLRADYPYLFSFAARTNPLRPDARAEVEE